MNDLLIEGSVSSPTVRGEWRLGILYMEGVPYPENFLWKLISSMVGLGSELSERKVLNH